jgi:hypothetical protein
MSSTHDPSPTVRIQHCKFPGCDVFLGVNFPSDWCGEHQQVGPLVARVVDLWNVGDGWIPGAAYRELASALGIPAERLLAVRATRQMADPRSLVEVIGDETDAIEGGPS